MRHWNCQSSPNHINIWCNPEGVVPLPVDHGFFHERGTLVLPTLPLGLPSTPTQKSVSLAQQIVSLILSSWLGQMSSSNRQRTICVAKVDMARMDTIFDPWAQALCWAPLGSNLHALRVEIGMGCLLPRENRQEHMTTISPQETLWQLL